MEIKTQRKKIAYAVFCLTVAFFCISGAQAFTAAEDLAATQIQEPQTSPEIENLNQEIDSQKAKAQEIEEKRKALEAQLNSVQRETYSLQRQISTIDNQIQDTEFEIQKKVIELDQHRLEIERLSQLITEKEKSMDESKVRLASLVRVIDERDRESKLYTFFSRDSFSSYLDDMQSAADLQVRVQSEVKDLKRAKEDLDTQKTEQEEKTKELEEAQAALERNQETLSQQKTYQQDLYQQSKDREVPYQQLVNQIKQEEDYANTQVRSLENAVRDRLFQLNKGLISNENVPLAWPVIKAGLNAASCQSMQTCSAIYHDPNYYSVFGRYHSAVDVPIPQSSLVYAPADGYITGLIPGYIGNGGLSILTIQHTDDQGLVTDMKTRFLHMSGFLVKYNPDQPQFVRKGDVIGYSGGKCGTMGAGTCGVHTTGPHLHFEVWVGSSVVNPLNYLP
ncbi:MAG: hypothetical protein COT25_00040 [Candidatus Kerfeldbacteria bacterium CG08_land_8_20_14_0_20_42_7]|uniref:M23ase beta-sheet core domain-containing protein n=1 Tax=Candidatus Kerfeldbacteria bacterium CG08_land_8_20_14_0_20_42_7 TaxID=2014245 RepID=A0A2H0YU37_9BACT|nr:MAG: hypothetical protein COT25_00040 [Candidatus Kerfeldbacteria bacterium CG08_land_8_20_14_0_20_42_7]